MLKSADFAKLAKLSSNIFAIFAILEIAKMAKEPQNRRKRTRDDEFEADAWRPGDERAASSSTATRAEREAMDAIWAKEDAEVKSNKLAQLLNKATAYSQFLGGQLTHNTYAVGGANDDEGGKVSLYHLFVVFATVLSIFSLFLWSVFLWALLIGAKNAFACTGLDDRSIERIAGFC